jgi:type IV secretory pathway VirB6-like protein
MLKKSKYLILGTVMAFMLSLAAPKAFADFSDDDGLQVLRGASITGGNCNADALVQNDLVPNADGTLKKPSQQSCIRQGVSLYGNPDLPFKINIHYNADEDIKANLETIGVLLGIALGGPQSLLAPITIPAFLTAFGIWAAVIDNDYTMDLNATKNIGFVIFETQLIGDKACVYAHMMGLIKFKVNRADYKNLPATMNVGTYPNIRTVSTDSVTKSDALPSNCIYAPPPRSMLQPPAWGNMISKVCTDYDSSASNFRWPVEPFSTSTKGDNRAFTGVVIQCIEDTMNNIFTNTDANGDTFFGKMQKGLVSAIRALLALYIIFVGYEYIVGKKGIKQEEWMWLGLRLALVLYFAAGSGMADMLPRLQNFTKSISLIVMEASAGNQLQAQDALNNMQTAENDFDLASQDLTQSRYKEAQARNALIKDPNNGALKSAVTAAQTDVAAKLTTYNDKLTVLNKDKADADSYGYKYCDFSDLGPAAYIDDKGIDHSNMRLWDMIDCKMSKYLGIGDYMEVRSVPNILIIGVASIFSHVFGIFIFAFILTILIFIILITVRVVHIYIMASIALVLLVYISPLIIPAALFKFTKDIFDKWLTNIIAYTIQPILLFTFLSFLFSAFDMVIYDGNHKFVPMTTTHNIDENRICMIRTTNGGLLCKSGDFDGIDENTLECVDKDAPGCIYHKLHIHVIKGPLGLQFYDMPMSFSQGKNLLIGLLKLILVSFIAHAVLGLVESMATTLTNAAGGGVSQLSGALKPGDVGPAGYQAATGLGKWATGTTIKAGMNHASKSSGVGKTRNAIRSTANKNP